MSMKKILPYLSSLDSLTNKAQVDGKEYIQPALRNLGVVSIVLVREIIAPTVFKNSDAEMTDIEIQTESGPARVVRAVPNKFKHRERARGLQLLRRFNAGGKFAQNKTNVAKDAKYEEIFDLNSFVFGDSSVRAGSVLPVKAASLYSDGLSTRDYTMCVSKTFHNRAAEDGTLFDAAKKKNSSNIFDRHFITPGTCFVQTISTIGKVMPPEALDHLLLSIGESGVYGGQTSISGVNVRNHIVGIYASNFEQSETSPYMMAAHLIDKENLSVQETIEETHRRLAPLHTVFMDSNESTEYLNGLIAQVNEEDKSLIEQYQTANEKVGNLFAEWFGGKAV